MSIARARSLRRRMSPPEARLWNALRLPPLQTLHFRRQVPLGPYYADFAAHAARLVIEVDGSTHSSDDAIAYDAHRTAFLTRQGYRVLRFATPEILGNFDGVLETIRSALPPPPSSAGGRSTRLGGR